MSVEGQSAPRFDHDMPNANTLRLRHKSRADAAIVVVDLEFSDVLLRPVRSGEGGKGTVVMVITYSPQPKE